MTERTGVIYSVRHKTDTQPFYIGQTRRSPEVRWAEHARGRTPLAKLLQLFGGIDDFVFTVIDHVPVSQLNEREDFWIDEYDTMAPRGLNHRKGGNAPFVSASSSAKRAKSLKIVMADPDFRKWRSETTSDMWQRPGVRAKFIDGINAAWASPERKARHSEAMKKTMADPDRRARISASMKAYRASLREVNSDAG